MKIIDMKLSVSKEIIEDIAQADDGSDHTELDGIYKWRKKWWLNITECV